MTKNKEKDSTSDSKGKSYAIVETSGSQYWLETDKYYDLDRINAKVDETIAIDKVLLINDEKGLSIGKPYVEGATVELKVLAHKRGKKIIVYKMRPKKKTRTKNGHRQELSRVMVTSISNGQQTKKLTSSKTKKETTSTNKAKKETTSTSKAKKETASNKKSKKPSVD